MNYCDFWTCLKPLAGTAFTFTFAHFRFEACHSQLILVAHTSYQLVFRLHCAINASLHTSYTLLPIKTQCLKFIFLALGYCACHVSSFSDPQWMSVLLTVRRRRILLTSNVRHNGIIHQGEASYLAPGTSIQNSKLYTNRTTQHKLLQTQCKSNCCKL
jgi:hypothetical protein